MHIGAGAVHLTAGLTPGRPRPQPTLDASCPQHLPKLAFDGHAVTLTPTLDTVFTVLRTGIIGAKPLGQQGHVPEVSAHPGHTLQIFPYALAGSAGAYNRTTGTDTSASFTLDGSSLVLSGSETFGGVTISLSTVTAAGLHGVFVTGNFAVGTHLISAALQLQIAPNTTRCGGTFVDTNLPKGTFWAVGVLFGITAMRSVTDGGAYRGLDVEKLAAARGVDLQHEALHCLQWVRLRGGSLNLRASGGTFKLALLGRLDFAHSRQMTWRRLCTAQQARDVLFEGEGLRFWLNNKARALSWRRDVLAAPRLADLAAVAVGDEVVHMRSSSTAPSFVLGNLVAFVGGQIAWRRDFETSRHRLDANLVEVTVNPTRIRNWGVFACNPFGPELDWGQDNAACLRQNLSFDHTQVAAHAAYARLLRKRAVGRWAAPPIDATYLREPTRLAKQMRVDRAHLPAGVTRNWVHGVISHETRYGGGIDLHVIPNCLVPRGWVTALGLHRSMIHEQQVATDGLQTTLADARVGRWQTDRGVAGQHRVETVGHLQWHQTETEGLIFDGLTWRAELTVYGARRDAVHKRLVRPLVRHFELELAPTRCPGLRQTRTVTLTQPCQPEGLGLAETHLCHHIQWMHAAYTAGVPHRQSNQLRQRLLASRAPVSPAARQKKQPALFAEPSARSAQLVQSFVARQGLKGCALLHKLTGAQLPLHLSSTTSSATEALAATARCVLRYESTALITTDLPALWARLCAVIQAQKSVAAALSEAQRDPFAPPHRHTPVHQQLVAAEEQLAKLIALPVGAQPPMPTPLLACAPRKRRLLHPQAHASLQGAVLGWLTSFETALAPAVAAQAQFQNTRLPWDYPRLAARWATVAAALDSLEARLAWLAAADVPLPQGQRPMQIKRTQTLCRALRGEGGIGGLVPVGALPPHIRQNLRRQGQRHGRTGGLTRRAYVAFMHDLDHLGGACPS